MNWKQFWKPFTQETVRRLEEAILKVQRQFSQEPLPNSSASFDEDFNDDPSNDIVFIDGDDDDDLEAKSQRSSTPVKPSAASPTNISVKTPSPVKQEEDHQPHRKRKHSHQVWKHH